jgi:hypothetical protein
MPAPLVSVTPGEMFAVPLFVSDEPVNKRFGARAFDGRGNEFAYLRVIAETGGAGILVEVFDRVGPVTAELEPVTVADRLFRPVAVAGLGIYKKRWKSLGVTPEYDRERDSAYSEIQLVLGPREAPRLWRGGVESPVSVAEAAAFERWIVWTAPDLEKRIIAALAA